MLTGEVWPSSGSATLMGYDLQTNARNAWKHVGYCPQYDALVDKLTTKELLTMYAHLRGIFDDDVSDEVLRLIDLLMRAYFTTSSSAIALPCLAAATSTYNILIHVIFSC